MKNAFYQSNRLKLFFIFIVLPFSILAQKRMNGKTYKDVPSKYINTLNAVVALKSPSSTYFDLTRALPVNYVVDGSEDYTNHLQKAIDKHDNVQFPDFPVLINDNGLTLRTNTSIRFAQRSKLILKSSKKGTYEVLRLHGVENVSIYHPVIVGDRDNHIGKDGEWGMGIAIRSSKNILIESPKISKCWGDGIYIGRLGRGEEASNIIINHAHLDFNRRNGLSVVSVKNFVLDGAVISNTVGTEPMSGIDIEPSSNMDVVNDITIKNVVTFNNSGIGIVINLSRLVGAVQRAANINISNFIDDESRVGFYISGVNSKGRFPGLNGRILLSDFLLINNATPINLNDDIPHLPKVEFRNLKVEKLGSKSLEVFLNKVKNKSNVSVD